jgi:undecaprenyl-diphosphatase
VAVALVARRSRLARDLAIAGTAAWLLAKVVKDIVSRAPPGRPTARRDPAPRTPTGLGFPSGHAAVAAALHLVVGAPTGSSVRPARR